MLIKNCNHFLHIGDYDVGRLEELEIGTFVSYEINCEDNLKLYTSQMSKILENEKFQVNFSRISSKFTNKGEILVHTICLV